MHILRTRTLPSSDVTLVDVLAHEDELESDAREIATEALIAALEIPLRAEYVRAEPANKADWVIVYRAESIRFEAAA